MKKLSVRLVIALLFSFFFCVSNSVNAEKVNEKKYSVTMVTQLQKFLTGETSSITQDFDINGDKKINAVDLSLLKRYVILGTPIETTITTTAVATSVSKVTTTKATTKATVTSKVTTKTTTHMTTTATSKSTTKATTKVTTTKNTTTITTNVTTKSTTKSTTVTTKVFTTAISTTSNIQTSATTMKPGYKLVEDSIHKVSISDTTIPNYTEDLHEAKDGIYLFSIGKETYAYTLLAEKNLSSVSLLANISLIKGAHIWKYSGNTSAVSIYDDLPDTSDLTFHAKDPTTTETEFEYELKEYCDIRYNDITMVAKIIEAKKTQYAADIGTYDYNLNEKLDNEDVEIMIKYFSSEPHNFFWTYNDDAVGRYFKNLPKLNHQNDVLITTTSTTPVPYAFNIPTADLVKNSTYKSVFVPIQMLPISFSSKLASYTELTKVSDETTDYLAWVPTENSWAKVSKESLNWKFQAGFYVYVLTSDGKYCQQWIQ